MVAMSRKLLGGSCAIALTIFILCYIAAKDPGSCSVRGAEFNGVDGYYYASGGQFIQRGNAGLSWLQPVDVFDVLNWRRGNANQASSTYSISLSDKEWTINNGRTVLYQTHLAAPDSPLGKTADSYLFYPPGTLGGWTLQDSSAPPRRSDITVECSGSLSASPPTAQQALPSSAGHAPSNLQQLAARPATTLLIAVLCGCAWVLYSSQTDPSTVSDSYEKIVTDGEWWRIITSAFAHFDLLHLGFNTMSLYQLGSLEEVYGSVRYAYLSFALVIITGFICLGISYLMITRMGREDMRFQQSVGFSCVIFAWIMAAAVRMTEFCPVIFIPTFCFKTWTIPVVGLPLNLGPVVLLFVTKVIIPRSSFIGHLSGLLIGIPLAWNLLDWMHPLWVISFLTSVYLLFAHDRMWLWKNSHCSSVKQDLAYFVHSAISGVCLLPNMIRAGAAMLGLELPEIGAGQGVRYSTLSVTDEESVQPVSQNNEGGNDSPATPIADGLSGMCVTVDHAWVSLEGFVPAEQLKVYNMFKWASLATIMSAMFEFWYTLLLLWGHTNVLEYAIFHACPLVLLMFLLWSAHQATRISHLTESTPTLQACVHMLVICLLYLVSLTAFQAATAGATWGSYRMINVNTTIDVDGRTLASNVTAFIATMNVVMLALQVCVSVLLVLILQTVPNVERREILGTMRLTSLAGLFEK